MSEPKIHFVRMEKYIEVKTTFKAYHRWKDAVEEVDYLRNWHRHLFHVTVCISVFENNRQLEFFMVQKRLDEYLSSLEHQKFEYSCEDIAEKVLGDFLIPTYGRRKYKVKVSEDGENAGIINYEPVK